MGQREGVLAATVACAGRMGLTGLTVEAVAAEAGLSRATVYRWFPGGREQLVDEAITWEVGQFLGRLADAVAGIDGVAATLEAALPWAQRALAEHTVLHHVLDTDPDVVLPHLQATTPVVLALMTSYVADLLAGEQLQGGVEPDEAAEYIARLFLSLVSTPGSWDLQDPAVVHHLVHDRLLAGIVA